MLHFIKLTISLLLLTIATTANADFSKTDWKASGDNMVISDSNTGMSWLSLVAVNGASYSKISEELSTTYAGWRFANKDEIFTMLANIWGYPILNTGSTQSYSGLWLNGAQLFSKVFGTGSTYRNFTIGTYYDNALNKLVGVGSYVYNGQTYTYGDKANISTCLTCVWSNANQSSYTSTGAFLVKDENYATNPPASVSAPIYAVSLIFGFSLLLGMRNKTINHH